MVLKNSDKEVYGVKDLLFDTTAEYTAYIATPEAAALKAGSRLYVPVDSVCYRKMPDGSFAVDLFGGND